MKKLFSCYINEPEDSYLVMLNVKLSLKIVCGLSNDLSIHSSQATKDKFKQAVITTTTHYRFVHVLFKT
jgi:hypothetical protein